jgi:hypothetical protein
MKNEVHLHSPREYPSDVLNAPYELDIASWIFQRKTYVKGFRGKGRYREPFENTMKAVDNTYFSLSFCELCNVL